MAVTSVVRRNPFSELSLDGGKITITDHYIVTLSADAANAPVTCLTASAGGVSIPAMYTGYSYSITGYSTCLLRRKNVQKLDNSLTKYEVVCEYNNDDQTQSDSQNDPETAPWLRSDATTYSYSYNNYEKALQLDLSDEPKPIVNTLGDPFDPPLTISIARPRIIIRRKRTSYHPGIARDLVNTCNSGSVSINGVTYGEGTCRLLSYSGESAYWEDPDTPKTYIPYYEQEIEIESIGKGETNLYQVEVANMGYFCLDQQSGERVRVSDLKGSDHPGLSRLDYDGYIIIDPAVEPYYNTFQIYKLASWGDLGLS